MMRIGVNTRFLLKNKMEGFGWYTYETMLRITRQHPEHEFVFFFDRAYDEKFIFANNINPVVLYPQARHPILQTIWFDQSIKRALKKYKCDLFLSPDGYLSLTTKVPQISVIHDLNFEHNPNDLPKNALRFYQKKFPLFARKAKRICTVSEYSKNDIVETYNIDPDKIDVTYNGVSSKFQPVAQAEIEKTQAKYANGNPYILFVGAIHKRKNINRLIQAFSILKKENEIPHHLVIVGEPMWKSQVVNIPHEMKANIHFTGHLELEILSKIMASASCLAFVSYFEGFGIPMVEAMQCGVPVLAGNQTALPEVGGDAVLYCNPYEVESIKKGLKTILTDEKLRSQLKQKGMERAKHFSWDNTANTLWKTVEKVME